MKAVRFRNKYLRHLSLAVCIGLLLIYTFYTEAFKKVRNEGHYKGNYMFFLKTHKTGTSTLQNIFERYAWNHNLIVGLPRSDIVFQSYYSGNKFNSADMEPIPAGKRINMIYDHMVFDQAEISSLLPKSAIYMTILRDPATLYRSAFQYFAQDTGAFRRAKQDGFDTFAKDPSRYFRGKDDGQFWWFAKNSMFFDLGFDNLNENEEYIKKSIKTIDETFDLVLITEYFDIGLILMKSRMGWDMQDVVYVSLNARDPDRDEETFERQKKLVYDWNKADTAMYKYFNNTFWIKVRQYGENKMKREVRELHFLKTAYREHCFEKKMISNMIITDESFKMFNPPGVNLMQYQLLEKTKHNETCMGLMRPPFQWSMKLHYRQKDL